VILSVSTETSTITIEPGCTFGEVNRKLWEEYPGWAIACGFDRNVGVVGAFTGCGDGAQHRRLGVGLD
jgi:FAD/FMN-containing dehydrogenase